MVVTFTGFGSLVISSDIGETQCALIVREGDMLEFSRGLNHG